MTVDKLLDAAVAMFRAATTTHLAAANMRVYKGYPVQFPKSRTICIYPANGVWEPFVIGHVYANSITINVHLQCPVVDDASTSAQTSAQQYAEFLEIVEEIKVLLASLTSQRLEDADGNTAYRVMGFNWRYGWPEDPQDRRKLYACEFEVVWRVPHE